jgi:hypothetical protein
MEEDLKILDKPRVLNRSPPNIFDQIAGIVPPLKRAFSFVVKAALLMRKSSHDRALKKKVLIPARIISIPKFIKRKRE